MLFSTKINHFESWEFLHNLMGTLNALPSLCHVQKFYVKPYMFEAVVHFLDQCSKILHFSERENKKCTRQTVLEVAIYTDGLQ